MHCTKPYSGIINGSMCLRVEKFTGAVEVEEERRRWWEGIKFLSKGLHDFKMASSYLEPQVLSGKLGVWCCMTSGYLSVLKVWECVSQRSQWAEGFLISGG